MKLPILVTFLLAFLLGFLGPDAVVSHGLVLFGQTIQPAGSELPKADSAGESAGESAGDSIELTIPSDGGIVRWSEVAATIATELKLDPEMTEQMMPMGSMDLTSGAVVLSLIAINLASNDAISFSIGNDAAGQQALKIRCRPDRLRLAGTQRNGTPRLRSRSVDGASKIRVVCDLDQAWHQQTANKPLVIFLHGMNSGPDVFDSMRRAVQTKGYATGAIGYDYQKPIKVSAAESMSVLRETLLDQIRNDKHARFPDLCLVGHSLGGLVARQMTESPADQNAKIVQQHLVQLITIGTPHRGSQWANLPPVADLLSTETDDAGGIVDVLLHRPSAASMRDLMPGSSFLTELNSRPRRDDVRYTSIIGTASPLSASDVDKLRQLLESMDQPGTLLRLIRPRIRPLLESFDELTAEKGDGIVSVSSARLPGIDDNIEVPVSHFEMIRKDEGGRDSVLDLLLDRLK